MSSGWNFIDDDEIRQPRSILREPVAEAEKQDDAAEWPRVRWTLMRVLQRFPDALEAVRNAINELYAKSKEPTPEWAT